MSDLQIQGEVVVTAEKAEGAFDRVADKATQMANEVAGAAGKAGQAVDGIGAGAEKSAERFTRSEARMRDAIQKSTQELQLLGKTASEKLEFNIAAKGLDAGKFAPYIAELKQAEAAQRIATGSLDKMGISAAQTAQALRQVPAQFTDIIVSLQAGQAPLTVLLQQGGQLKDMFGGVGNAAKALGGYVVGLISPLTIAAAAAVALAIAYKQGSAEADGYNRAIAMTGNAAGTTAAQLQTMAARISTTVGTQSDAADTLAQLVSTGRVAQENLEQFATTAVQLERTAGVAIKDTVKDFAELGKAPVEAAKKLNESYGFLTAAVYEQIVALQEQGRVLEAAAVAQQAYERAMSNVAATMQGQLGYIERGWRAVADAAKAGWDAMLNVGRADTLTDKLNAARAALDQRVNTPLAVDNEAMRASRQKGIDSLRQEIALLTEQERVMKRGAEAQALRTQAEKDGVAAAEALQKAQDKGLSKQQQLNKALEDYRKQLADLRAVNPNSERLTPAAVARGEKGIRDQFKETGSAGTGENEVAQIRARTIELQRYLELLRTHGAEAEKMTESEKLVIKIQEELKTSITGTARAQKEKALAEAQGQVAVERQVVAEQARIKALKESEAALNSQIDAVRKQASSTLEQAVAQESVNANMGKSKTAVEQATLAQLKLQQAEADSSDRSAPAYVAALTAKTEAQERFVKALQQAEFLQKSSKLDEAARAAAEETATLELQISLIGRSQVERDKIIAQRQAEVRLAKELAEIEKINLGEGPEADSKRAELRAKAQANAVVEANNAANKAVLGEWQRTADSINNSLTDALLRGFESGKGFAKNLRDTVVNMFKTLVLRPIISAIINPVAGAVTGLLGFGGQAAAAAASGGGGALSGLSALSSGASLLAGNFGAGLTTGFGQLMSGNIIGGLQLGGGLIGSGATAGGLGTIMGVLGPIALGVGALMAIAKATKGETRTGGQFGVSFDGTVTNQRRDQVYTYQGQQFDRDFSNGQRNALIAGQAYRLEGDPVQNEQAIRDAVSGTASGINAFLKALGSKATLTGFSAGLETSSKGRGGVFAGGILSDGTTFGESGKGDNYAGTLYEKFSTNSPDFKTALENFTLDLKQSTIQALQSVTDIPQTVQKMLKGVDAEALSEEAANALLESINAQIVGVQNLTSSFEAMGLDKLAKMGFDAAAGLAAAAGGFDKLQGNLNTYYDNFYSEEERKANMQKQLDKQFAELGIDVPKNREEFRKLVEDTLAQVEVQDKAKASLSKQINDAVAAAGGGKLSLSDMGGRSIIAGIDPALLGNGAADPAVAGKLNGFLGGLSDLSKQGLDPEAFQKGVTGLIDMNSEVLGIGKDASKTAATLLGLSGVFAGLNESAEETAARISKEQADARDKALRGLERAVAREKEALQTQIDVAQDVASTMNGLFDLLKSNVQDLYDEVDSTRSMLAAQGNDFITQALATARTTGYLPDETQLADAISAARSGLDATGYTSQFAKDRDRLVLAGQLSELEGLTGKQLTSAERTVKELEAQSKQLDKTLDYWKQQIEIANGTYEATLSVADAVKSLEKLMFPDKGEIGTLKPQQVGGGGSSGGAGFGPGMGGGTATKTTIDATTGKRTFSDGSVDYLTEGELDLYRRGILGKVPFYDVGTDYVPRDMLAMVHEGEKIVPKAYNPAANPGMAFQGSDVVAELRALREAVEVLQQAASATASNTALMPQMADQFDTVAANGVLRTSVTA